MHSQRQLTGMSGYKLYSDDQLLELLKADDHAAFTEIYARYSEVVYKNAIKLLNDRAEVMASSPKQSDIIVENQYGKDCGRRKPHTTLTAGKPIL
jgi:hypothetical protein